MGFVGENFSDEMSTYDDTILHFAMRKIVFSRTLKRAEWNNSEVLREIDLEVITRLKQQDGKHIQRYQREGYTEASQRQAIQFRRCRDDLPALRRGSAIL